MDYKNPAGGIINNINNEYRTMYKNFALRIMPLDSYFQEITKVALDPKAGTTSEFDGFSIGDFQGNKTIKTQIIDVANGYARLTGNFDRTFNNPAAPELSVNVRYEEHVVGQDWEFALELPPFPTANFFGDLSLERIYQITKEQRLNDQSDGFKASRVSKYANIAYDYQGNKISNIISVDSTASDFDALTVNDQVDKRITNLKIPTTESQIMYVSASYYLKLKTSPTLTRFVNVDTNTGLINRTVVRLDDGLTIIRVPDDLMKHDFISETVNGTKILRNSGRAINFIRITNSANIFGVIVDNVLKMLDGRSRDGSFNNSLQTRLIHDLFIPEKMRAGVVVGLEESTTGDNAKLTLSPYINVANSTATVAANVISSIQGINATINVEKGSTPAFAAADTAKTFSVEAYHAGKRVGVCYITSDGTVPAGAPTTDGVTPTAVTGTFTELLSPYNNEISATNLTFDLSALTITKPAPASEISFIFKSGDVSLSGEQLDARVVEYANGKISYNDADIYNNGVSAKAGNSVTSIFS